jgi:hypothetical protein
MIIAAVALLPEESVKPLDSAAELLVMLSDSLGKDTGLLEGMYVWAWGEFVAPDVVGSKVVGFTAFGATVNCKKRKKKKAYKL